MKRKHREMWTIGRRKEPFATNERLINFELKGDSFEPREKFPPQKGNLRKAISLGSRGREGTEIQKEVGRDPR